MQSKTVREDQAQFVLNQLEETYRAYGKIPQQPYLRPEQRAEIRQQLETSTKQAKQAIGIMDAQPGGISPVLQGLKSKLIFWSTMAEGELKTTL